jgi:hypothetical protein
MLVYQRVSSERHIVGIDVASVRMLLFPDFDQFIYGLPPQRPFWDNFPYKKNMIPGFGRTGFGRDQICPDCFKSPQIPTFLLSYPCRKPDFLPPTQNDLGQIPNFEKFGWINPTIPIRPPLKLMKSH